MISEQSKLLYDRAIAKVIDPNKDIKTQLLDHKTVIKKLNDLSNSYKIMALRAIYHRLNETDYKPYKKVYDSIVLESKKKQTK